MKRFLSIAAAVALTATLAAVPANAGAAKVIIEDPQGDSNFVNDQGTGDGSFGDRTAGRRR